MRNNHSTLSGNFFMVHYYIERGTEDLDSDKFSRGNESHTEEPAAYSVPPQALLFARSVLNTGQSRNR